MTRDQILAQLRQSAVPQLTVGTLTTDDQTVAIETLVAAEIPMLHIDIMDGQVWPKTTVGPEFVANLKTELKTDLIKDVHLLVNHPEEHILAHAAAGAGAISFSIEYTDDLAGCLKLIEQGGDHVLRGVSLNPATSLEIIEPFLTQIDFVILLAIGPDTGKETFFDDLPAKIATLRQWKPELLITIDGAVKKDNIGDVARMNPDFIATGSAVFDGIDPAGNIQFMKQKIAASQTA